MKIRMAELYFLFKKKTKNTLLHLFQSEGVCAVTCMWKSKGNFEEVGCFLSFCH